MATQGGQHGGHAAGRFCPRVLEALFDALPEAAIFANRDRRIVSVNPATLRLFGYAEAELVGQSTSLLYADLRDFEALGDLVFRAGGPALEAPIELRYRRKSGETFWAETTGSSVNDDEGKLVGYIALHREATERKSWEVRLKRSDAKLNALLDAAPAGIALFDPELRYLRINQALADMNGMPIEDHVGRTNGELRPKLAALVEPSLRAVLETGEPTSFELSGPRAVGTGELHVMVHYYPIRVEGEVSAAAAIVLDITDRKQTERRSELLARISSLMSSSLDYGAMLSEIPRILVPALGDWCSVFLDDDAGNVELAATHHVDPAKAQIARELFANRRITKESTYTHAPGRVARDGGSAFAHSPEQFERLVASDPIGRAVRAHFEPSSWLAVPIAVHGMRYGALTVGTGPGHRRLVPRDLAFVEELGRRIGVALDNARLFAAAQVERRRAEEAARAKDEFLAVVSHELRTPLNAMLGWTRMLRMGSLDAATQARALETIERNARAQTQLIEDILDVSRIVTGKLRLNVASVLLRDIVMAAVDSARPAAHAKGVELVLDISREQGPFRGDPDRLQQVVWNLVSNAVKFTPRGGEVRVTLARVGPSLVVRVEDSGRGIDPDFLPYVFDRFRQAESSPSRAHGGLGLGLAIVKHIVELHGGTVWATSQGRDTGATFAVSLPVVAAPEAPIATTEPAVRSTPPDREVLAPMPELVGLRVLVIEDEPDALHLLESVLTHARAEVKTADSADEALRIVSEWRPEVLVSDIGLPGEDGYALIRKVRELPDRDGGRVRAVALTAYARMEDRTRALLAGFDMHVPKPVEPAELLVAIAALSERARKG